ncbi:EamA family transporter [Pelagicoccus albus]|uniref:DMT family transporter n=1 Tax=Pelagicoccus albus TaxID=415222 RepID=A0A7X1B4C7_9BACT|nr:DMT family transporter [Pelagicoccus albus]
MNPTLARERQTGILLVSAAGVCWGFHGVLIKFAYQLGASFMEVLLAETAVATLAYLIMASRASSLLSLPKELTDWIWLTIAGIASIGVGSFLFLSFSLGPVAIGATLLFLYLPQVYLHTILVAKQPANWLGIASIVLLLIGAGITTDAINVFSGNVSSAPILAGAAASVCYAAIFILTPKLSVASSATFNSLFLAASSAIGSLIILAVVPATRSEASINLIQFAAIAFVLGIIGQMLPVLAMMKGIPLAGSSLSGVLASIELPVAVVSSALLLGESVTPGRAIGVALVFLGIIFFNLSNRTET